MDGPAAGLCADNDFEIAPPTRWTPPPLATEFSPEHSSAAANQPDKEDHGKFLRGQAVGADVARWAVPMRKAFVEPVDLPEPRFRDGLGVRYVRTDGTDDPVEVLRPLWDVGAMQNAIRQRVGRLATFRQARFVPVRAAEVPRDDASTIEIVSDYVSGHRLSQYLEAARDGAVTIETSTALYILRELLGALALLHESRGVTHGAVGPERILINPKGRVVVADYVLGPAIERLEFTRPRLWREFRVALPAGKGAAKLDDKADVVQVGITALALLLGRPIEIAQYPERIEELLAAINQGHRAAGRIPVPAVLIGWLKRAVFKDPNAKFANVSEARLALEAAISKQEAASGGAAALKALAEAFGRHAAALEAKAAADAAEEARKAMLAAQAATAEALQEQADAAAAAVPLADLVPAFPLDSAQAPASPEDSALRSSLDAAQVSSSESDDPVGWRVPEAPVVEDTLPTSPLLQIDATLAAPAPEEFAEEVLDLSELAVADDADAASAGEPIAAEQVGALVESRDTQEPALAAAASETVVEEIVDLRELDGIEAPQVSAELYVTSRQSEPAVDEAIAALEAQGAEEAPPGAPVADLLPEWRLLADPVGAAAPTIDVDIPTESLEELVAEFAAAVVVEAIPAVVEAAAVAEEPAPELEPRAGEPAPESRLPEQATPGAVIPSVLEELLSLQDAQAAAQASVVALRTEPQAASVDIAAWSFVEELVHHDTRFEVPPATLSAPAEEPLSDVPPMIEHSVADVEDAAAPIEDAAPGIEEAAIQAIDEAAAQDVDEAAPALPADWLIEVGIRVTHEEPVAAQSFELPAVLESEMAAPPAPSQEGPAAPPPDMPLAALTTPVPEPRDAFAKTTDVVRETADRGPEVAVSMPPAARRPELPSYDEENATGPVFPRVAPSVQRVRAEARRRRLARLTSGIGHGFHATGSACASAVASVVGGVVQLFASVGNGLAVVGGSVLAGSIASVTAVSRGIGGAIRASASGLAAIARMATFGGAAALRAVAVFAGAVGRGVLQAGRAVARAARAGTIAASAGAGRGLRAVSSALIHSAGAASKGAVAAMRASAGALSTGGRALASGVGALGRAGMRLAGAVLRFAAAFSSSVGRAAGAGLRRAAALSSSLARVAGAGVRLATVSLSGLGRLVGRAAAGAATAATSARGLAGRGAARTGKGLAHVAVAAPRRLYFLFSDVADRLPKPRLRLSYLAVALLAISAVAGVPYAKALLFTAKPVVGTIRVEAARPDAMVTIDGVAQGRAPVTATVPVGRHRIEVTSGGKTRVHDVEVSAGSETLVQAAGADLKGMGSVRVTTDPDAAEVLVDGVLRGTSPLIVDSLAEGTHTILVRDGSGSVRRTVRVRADETAEATLQIVRAGSRCSPR